MSGGSLSAGVGGQVMEVNFHEGDEVQRGDVLIRLDPQRLENELAKIERRIKAGEEELANMGELEALTTRRYEKGRAKVEAELTQARRQEERANRQQVSQVRLAELELERTQQERKRLEGLVAHGAESKGRHEEAIRKVREAEEKLKQSKLPADEGRSEVARRALEEGEVNYAVQQKELQMKRMLKRAEVDVAKLTLANLELERERTVIRAHTDGVVTAGDIKVGDIVQAGKPVVAIAQQRGFRIDLAVPSEEVGHLSVGMRAKVKLDAYDYQKYGTAEGTVMFISPDSELVEGPDGSRRVIYMVKIALEREEVGRGDLRGHIKLGMSGLAEIVTGRESVLSLMLKKIRQTISLG